MEVVLTDDQRLFHQTSVRFIRNELPLDQTRHLHGDPVGFERAWWERVAELGWLSVLVPEEDGGGSISGAGLVDAAIIAEELGRNVQPGPFVPANVVAQALSAAGTGAQRSDVLQDIMSGRAVATWAWAGTDGEWDGGAGLVATRERDGFRLEGQRGFVQDAVGADFVLVVAQLDGRPAQFLVPTRTDGLSLQSLQCLDLSHRMSHLTFSGVRLPTIGLLGQDDASDSIETQLQIAVVLNCAESVGAMDATFEMMLAYSKERIAFGRPIGSFQALKHILADQSLVLETCKAGAAAAANAVQSGDEHAGPIVSMVAAYIGDMSNELAQMGLQIHGGIGYTWEYDLHLLMRRIRSNAALYGEPTWHRERVCALAGLGREGRE